MASNKVTSNILLSEGPIEGATDLVNFTLEYLIFFRWIYFKNRPRVNLLLVRTIMIIGLFAFAFFQVVSDFSLVLAGIEIDPVIALFIAVVVGFWNTTNTFYNKASSCNEVYLSYLSAITEDNYRKIFVLRNALALQLLTLDLWAHRLYRSLFAADIEAAIKYAFLEKIPSDYIDTNQDMDDFIENTVNKGKLKLSQARWLLSNYQDALLRGDIEIVAYL